MKPNQSLIGFSGSFCAVTTHSALLRHDCDWRLRHHYIPTMAGRSLALTGVALDIGAGFGSFSIPFCEAFRGWKIVSFEPEPECFAALLANRRKNLIPIPVAIGGPDCQPAEPHIVRERLIDTLNGGPVNELVSLLPRRKFYRKDGRGYYQALKRLFREILEGSRVNFSGLAPRNVLSMRYSDLGYMEREYFRGSIEYEFPVLASNLLEAISPSLLKITAPKQEKVIFEGLYGVELDDIIGECWDYMPSACVVHDDLPGRRHTWLPIAGPGLLSIRKGSQDGNGHARLDVVVATKNNQESITIVQRIAALQSDPAINILVIVVGSDDRACAQALQETSESSGTIDRKLVAKDIQTAFDLGRKESKASHIMFIDAERIGEPCDYSVLLELSRQSGAEIVLSPCHESKSYCDSGNRKTDPHSGHEKHPRAYRHGFAGQTCYLAPSSCFAELRPRLERQVFLRDFLDSKNVWFSNREGDDPILTFHLITMNSIESAPVLEGISVGIVEKITPDLDFFLRALASIRIAFSHGLREAWISFDSLWSFFGKIIVGCRAHNL